MTEIIRYTDIRDSLSCLDMLCCDHKRLFWRYVGHTASVYRSGAGQVQVLESTQMSYSGVSGVQLHPMGEWLANYPGQVHVRRLLYRGRPYLEHSTGLALEMQHMQESFIRIHLNTLYPDVHQRSGRLKLILARLDFEINGRDLLSYHGKDPGIFCTQLKAMELQSCGVMRDDIDAKEAEPRNTREHAIGWAFDDYMVYPWSFGPEIRLK